MKKFLELLLENPSVCLENRDQWLSVYWLFWSQWELIVGETSKRSFIQYYLSLKCSNRKIEDSLEFNFKKKKQLHQNFRSASSSRFPFILPKFHNDPFLFPVDHVPTSSPKKFFRSVKRTFSIKIIMPFW